MECNQRQSDRSTPLFGGALRRVARIFVRMAVDRSSPSESQGLKAISPSMRYHVEAAEASVAVGFAEGSRWCEEVAEDLAWKPAITVWPEGYVCLTPSFWWLRRRLEDIRLKSGTRGERETNGDGRDALQRSAFEAGLSVVLCCDLKRAVSVLEELQPFADVMEGVLWFPGPHADGCGSMRRDVCDADEKHPLLEKLTAFTQLETLRLPLAAGLCSCPCLLPQHDLSEFLLSSPFYERLCNVACPLLDVEVVLQMPRLVRLQTSSTSAESTDTPSLDGGVKEASFLEVLELTRSTEGSWDTTALQGVRCPSLRVFQLTDCDDTSFVPFLLASAKRIDKVGLTSCTVGESVLKAVAACLSIYTLELCSSVVRGDAACLARLERLRVLDLSDAELTDTNDLEFLSSVHQLVTLDLDGAVIKSPMNLYGVPAVVLRSNAIQHLKLHRTQITDGDLECLCGNASQLQELYLSHSPNLHAPFIRTLPRLESLHFDCNTEMHSLEIRGLPLLNRFEAHRCPVLSSLTVALAPSLECFAVFRCPVVSRLELSRDCCKGVRDVCIEENEVLDSLGFLSGMPSLRVLRVLRCALVRSVSLCGCGFLDSLFVRGCAHLRQVSLDSVSSASVSRLSVEACGLFEGVAAPGFPQLREASFSGCDALEETLVAASGLETLNLEGCKLIRELDLTRFPNLKHITFP